MTRKERDNRKTDRAWENVYQRLEKDGLLDHKEKNSIIPYGDMRRPPLWKIISATAAMLVFCIYLSTIYFNQTNKETDRNLLTRQNMETTTLATTLEDGSTSIWQATPPSITRNIFRRTKERSPYREMLFSTLQATASVLSLSKPKIHVSRCWVRRSM